MLVALGYGRTPKVVDLPFEPKAILKPRTIAPVANLKASLRSALRRPVDAAPLCELARRAARIAIIVPDDSRKSFRSECITAVFDELGDDARKSIVIVATGQHEPRDIKIDDARAPSPLIHDGDAHEAHVMLGVTQRGTPVELDHRVVEADLVIAIGEIVPHYFAGYAGGAKAIFPGVASKPSIRKNHLMKAAPGARSGIIDGNPCRQDMEEAARMLPATLFCLNVVPAPEGGAAGAIAGDIRAAHRAGVGIARGVFEVACPACDVAIVSSGPPLSRTLYQASKLVAMIAPFLREGGEIVLAAECDEGVGDLEFVNQSIYKDGLRSVLPAQHRVLLCSSMQDELVRRTYCEPIASMDEVVASYGGKDVVVVPSGSGLLPVWPT